MCPTSIRRLLRPVGFTNALNTCVVRSVVTILPIIGGGGRIENCVWGGLGTLNTWDDSDLQRWASIPNGHVWCQ